MILQKYEWRLQTPLGFVFLLVLLFSGCARTEQVPPAVESPAAFSQTGAMPLADEWWRSLDDDRLDVLMEQAMDENFSLKAAYDRVLQARAETRAARADFVPEILASGERSHEWFRDDITRMTESARNYGVTISASYEVDLWGRIRSLQNAEALEAAASEEDLRAAAVTISSNVASTWYQLREQVSQLELLDSQIETTAKTLTVLETRFKRGLTGAADVLQQRQLLESRKEEKERAVAERRLLEINLAALLAMPPPEPGRFDADGGLIELPPLPATGIPAEVVAKRPDVQSAYLLVQSVDQRVASAIAERYPRLSLSASYSTTEMHWQDLFDNWVTTVAANLLAPVLDGGARRAEVERQQAVLRERFHNYADVYLNALAEVESALISESQQRRVVESINNQIGLARDVQERIGSEYLNGRAEYLRVLDAQQTLQDLERELLTERRALIESRVDLARALSGGWESPAYEEPEVVDEYLDIYPFPIPLYGDVE